MKERFEPLIFAFVFVATIVLYPIAFAVERIASFARRRERGRSNVLFVTILFVFAAIVAVATQSPDKIAIFTSRGVAYLCIYIAVVFILAVVIAATMGSRRRK